MEKNDSLKKEKPKRVIKIKNAMSNLSSKIDKKAKIAILSALSLITFLLLPSFVKLYALPALGFNEYRKGRKL